jgi:hypothetical protein
MKTLLKTSIKVLKNADGNRVKGQIFYILAKFIKDNLFVESVERTPCWSRWHIPVIQESESGKENSQPT